MTTVETNKQWWKEPPNEVHAAVFAAFRELQKSQDATYQRHLRNFIAYTGREVGGLTPGELVEAQRDEDEMPLMRIPVSRSCVETAFAQHFVNRPRIQVLTDGASWHEAQKARMMQRFLDGIMDAAEGYVQTDKQGVDGLVFGSGFVRVSEDKDPVAIEWQFAPEIWADEQCCLTAEPVVYYQQKWVDPEMLITKYGITDEGKRDAVRSSAGPKLTETGASAMMVSEVVCSLRRSSTKEAKDGRRVICVEKATLVDEPWEFEDSDLIKWDWSRPPAGWWGIGILEEAEPFQEEVNEQVQKNQRTMNIGSRALVLQPASCNVPDDHVLSEDEFKVIKYEGPQPPSVTLPDVVSPQQLLYPFQLAERVYEFLGISLMDAQARKPEGLNSGKAIREFKGVSAGRGAMKDRSLEQNAVRLAKAIIRIMRRRAERKESIAVTYSRGDTIEKISWRDVDLPEENYRIRCFPTSLLPTEPAGKIAFIQELVGMGWLDPDLGVELLDMPDLDKAQSIKLAAIKHVQWMMDEILYKGRYHKPDPIMDLELGIKWCRGTYLYAQQHSAPEEVLHKLAEWLLEAREMRRQDVVAQAKEQQDVQAAIAPPLPAGGVMPGAPPPVPVPSQPDLLASGGAGVPPSIAAPR